MQLPEFIKNIYHSSSAKQFAGMLLILLAACAQPFAPTGGPQDTEPPVILRSEPENGSVNFDSKEIRIWFDEFIQLRGLSQQFLSSPPFNKTPETRLRGKSLIIKLEEELRPNTTYTLFFGDAIADFTEGNPISNFRYVFSTGPVLDSMKITGKVMNAYSLKPEKQVFVMLYDIYEDSIPYKERPYYISRTDDNGLFTFTNLRDIPYKVFALRDVNANLIYDQPNEEIGFIDSLVHPFAPVRTKEMAQSDSLMFYPENDEIPLFDENHEHHHDSLRPDEEDLPDLMELKTREDSLVQIEKVPSLTILLFNEVDSTQRIEKAEYLHPNRLNFVFRYPVKNLVIHPLPPLDFLWKMEEFTPNRDTLIYWLLEIDSDSIFLEISADNLKADTVGISLSRLNTFREERESDTTVYRLDVRSQLQGRMPADIYKPAEILFTEPLEEAHLNRIQLFEDSVRVNPNASFADQLQKKLLINFPWRDTTRYELLIPDSVFRGIYGNYNDTLKYNFRTKGRNDYGNLKINLDHSIDSGTLIVQLLDERDNLIKQEIIHHNEYQVEFKFLSPVKYKLKVIHDANANKKWDTGVYPDKLQPERVYVFEKTIELRPNWDIEETFSIRQE
jgi:hypothetical protein